MKIIDHSMIKIAYFSPLEKIFANGSKKITKISIAYIPEFQFFTLSSYPK